MASDKRPVEQSRQTQALRIWFHSLSFMGFELSSLLQEQLKHKVPQAKLRSNRGFRFTFAATRSLPGMNQALESVKTEIN